MLEFFVGYVFWFVFVLVSCEATHFGISHPLVLYVLMWCSIGFSVMCSVLAIWFMVMFECRYVNTASFVFGFLPIQYFLSVSGLLFGFSLCLKYCLFIVLFLLYPFNDSFEIGLSSSPVKQNVLHRFCFYGVDCSSQGGRMIRLGYL